MAEQFTRYLLSINVRAAAVFGLVPYNSININQRYSSQLLNTASICL